MIQEASDALASCRLPTSLKRPDRSKQCHCRQFAQIASFVACSRINGQQKIVWDPIFDQPLLINP